MTTTTTRRAILAGAAALPALAVPAAALAAIQKPDDPDADLRRLWAQYCAELDAYRAVEAVHAPRRAALDREMEPFYVSETSDPYINWGGYWGWRDAHDAVFKKAWRKHKVGGPWRTMNRFYHKIGKTVAAIRAIEAQTLFGIGIKLAAHPTDVDLLDVEDYREALQSALPDLDALCGGSFAEMAAVQS
jgi:hypothetical protein